MKTQRTLTPSLQSKIDRMEEARELARQTGNHRLVTTLTEMLNDWSAKGVKPSQGEDLNHLTETIRPIINPKRMAIKLKSEKYDTRIEAPSEKTVARRLRISKRASSLIG